MNDTRSAHSRPLSPHLQIYRPQLTSVLSIFHRITGAALTVGLFVVAGWIVSVAMGAQSYTRYTELLHTILGTIVLVGFSWALFYHLGNGIRHLFWDMGKGFDLKDAYRSGWAVVICSFLLTALCWVSVYYVKHNTMQFFKEPASQRLGAPVLSAPESTNSGEQE